MNSVTVWATVATQQDTLSLTKACFQAGLSSDLDVSRAAAQMATTTAEMPRLENALKQTMHRLNGLSGQAPGALAALLSQTDPLPSPPSAVPVDLPSDLLRRRPDIRYAERELAAATARIGIAIAELFPRFSLTGFFRRDASAPTLRCRIPDRHKRCSITSKQYLRP